MASDDKQFTARMRELLVNLPYDLKVLFEAITDEDLPAEVRRVAAGTAIYCISPADPIPDHLGLVGFVDDAILVRLALKRMLDLGGDEITDYPERFAEQFVKLDDDLALVREYLGESLTWLEGHIDQQFLPKVKYKGKKVPEFIENAELSQMLYEDGLEFTTEYEIDDDAAQRLTSGKPVLDAFEKRRQFEESRRGG